jgi:nucleoid DNA-binding protein
MNTTDLKNEVYRNLSKSFSPALTKEEISTIVDTVIDAMSLGLTTNDEEGENKVVLRGFGTLKVVNRKGRTYSVRGKQVTVGDRKTVVFKPGTDLAKSISE